MTAPEAYMRMQNVLTVNLSHCIILLYVYLPNKRAIIFEEYMGRERMASMMDNKKHTSLEAYFKLNQTDSAALEFPPITFRRKSYSN